MSGGNPRQGGGILMTKIMVLAVFLFVGRAFAAPTGWKTESAPVSERPSITKTFPNLADLTFKEPKSDFYLGFGVGPVGAVHGRTMFEVDFFQVHWIRDYWDIEILNASYGITMAQPSYLESRHFTFRASPKIRFFKMISIGPLFGYEFVSFPQINTKILKAPWSTPNYEPFSSKGPIYGVALSETFPVWTDYILKLNEIYYQETYSADKTTDGWDYLYEKRELRDDRSSVGADTVFMVEVSLLF
jgi:hypothetical protein